jgi:hypothetical protein
VFVVKVDNPSRAYCLYVEENISNISLLYEGREVEDPNQLPSVLKVAAEQSMVKHILVVGSVHEQNETVTLGSRMPNGKVPGGCPSVLLPSARVACVLSSLWRARNLHCLRVCACLAGICMLCTILSKLLSDTNNARCGLHWPVQSSRGTFRCAKLCESWRVNIPTWTAGALTGGEDTTQASPVMATL